MARKKISRGTLTPAEAGEIQFFEKCRAIAKSGGDTPAVVVFDFLADAFERLYSTRTKNSTLSVNWNTFRQSLLRILKEDGGATTTSRNADLDRLRRVGNALNLQPERDSFFRLDLGLAVRNLFDKASQAACGDSNVSIRLGQDGEGTPLLRLIRSSTGKRSKTPVWVKIIESADEAYHELIEYVEHHQVQKATLIQLSATSSRLLLKALLEQEAWVRVFIADKRLFDSDSQLPVYLPIDEQRTHLKDRIKKILDYLSHSEKIKTLEKLSIHEYDIPPWLLGVKFDKNLLLVSWYRYISEKSDGEAQKRELRIEGHSSPTILIASSLDAPEDIDGMVRSNTGSEPFQWFSDVIEEFVRSTPSPTFGVAWPEEEDSDP